MEKEKLEPNLEWKKLYDHFESIEEETVISYRQLNELLENSGDIRTDKRSVFEKFKKEMLLQRYKALENIRNKGYRVVRANEHVRLTNREIKRAERRARQAVNIILHTDLSRLNDREKVIATLAATKVQPILASIIGEQKALQEDQKFKSISLPKFRRADNE